MNLPLVFDVILLVFLTVLLGLFLSATVVAQFTIFKRCNHAAFIISYYS